MADKKISQLSSVTTPLSGTEEIPAVQSGTTKKATVADFQSATVAAGTANGVQFLNASKAPTTSTRLTFDGSEIFKNSGGVIQLNDISGSAAAGTRMAGGGTLGVDSFSVFQNGAGAYILNSAGTSLNLGTNNINSQLTVDTSGNVAVAFGNLVIGTAGKGIDFSATASGSGTMTSELLADYEEGTWTGTMTGGTTAPTTPVTATGNYTRIGNTVTISIIFTNKDTTGASGQLLVTGLPFTSKSAVNQIGSVATYGLSIPNKTLNTWITGGTTNIEFISAADNGAWNFPDITAGANKYLNVTMTYHV